MSILSATNLYDFRIRKLLRVMKHALFSKNACDLILSSLRRAGWFTVRRVKDVFRPQVYILSHFADSLVLDLEFMLGS